MINGRKWTFATDTKDPKGKIKLLSLYNIANTTIERHIKVQGNASPDDPTWKEYWDKRHQKYGKSRFNQGSMLYKIAQNQNWKCSICGEPLFNGEEIETHHIAPVAQGGLDNMENLQHIHLACHKQVHSKSKLSRLK